MLALLAHLSSTLNGSIDSRKSTVYSAKLLVFDRSMKNKIIIYKVTMDKIEIESKTAMCLKIESFKL